MTIHNDNNIQAVTVFEESYSNTFLSICPVLKGFEVYCIDIDWDNIPQEFHPLTKQDFNCPYMTIQWNGKRYIFRSMVICQGYTPEEEIALIAHEFGHIICAVADLHPNNKNNTALEEIEDSQIKIINNYLMMELIGTDDIETKRKMMNKVTKNEIVKVAKKVTIDTIFCLEGVKNEEN